MALSNEVHVPHKLSQTGPNYLTPDMSISHDTMLISNPLMRSKVALGMVMQSVPCAPLSRDLSFIAGLDNSHVVDSRYIPLSSQSLAPITEVIQQINFIPMTPHIEKVITDGGSMVFSSLPPTKDSTKTDVNSSDIVVCNLQKLEMKTPAQRDIPLVPLNLSIGKELMMGNLSSRKRKFSKLHLTLMCLNEECSIQSS
ncbi:hypothetical protein Ancab_005203 [Ancistrocladus abbreviatus]